MHSYTHIVGKTTCLTIVTDLLHLINLSKTLVSRRKLAWIGLTLSTAKQKSLNLVGSSTLRLTFLYIQAKDKIKLSYPKTALFLYLVDSEVTLKTKTDSNYSRSYNDAIIS